jgi:molybdopterin synthase catalytic subunit
MALSIQPQNSGKNLKKLRYSAFPQSTIQNSRKIRYQICEYVGLTLA